MDRARLSWARNLRAVELMRNRKRLAAALLLSALPLSIGTAQSASPQEDSSILLTVFLRHDQSKTLDEIQTHLKRTGFQEKFPPPGIQVVSWYVMMGIGQVVTLRVPADKLRDLNLSIERGAWGAYRTEFYPTYDYKPVWEAERAAKKPSVRQ